MIKQLPEPKKYEVQQIPEEYYAKDKEDEIKITVEGNIYSIEAEFFDKILSVLTMIGRGQSHVC